MKISLHDRQGEEMSGGTVNVWHLAGRVQTMEAKGFLSAGCRLEDLALMDRSHVILSSERTKRTA